MFMLMFMFQFCLHRTEDEKNSKAPSNTANLDKNLVDVEKYAHKFDKERKFYQTVYLKLKA